MNFENHNIGKIFIIVVSLVGIVGALMIDPIAQDPEYHLFIDQRTILGLPNFWNVTSNLLFLLVGIMGLYHLLDSQNPYFAGDMKTAYLLFFTGVSLVAFGSGYYHLWPDNNTLVWDRLPMTIAFMALFAIIIAEFVSEKLGKYSLWPLIVIGAFSVFFWSYTESRGEGDLRLYALVQFLPIIIIPLLLLFFQPKFTGSYGYWQLLAAYLFAKILEYFDTDIFNLLPLISGHSLKHIAAAIGVFLLLRALHDREPVPSVTISDHQ